MKVGRIVKAEVCEAVDLDMWKKANDLADGPPLQVVLQTVWHPIYRKFSVYIRAIENSAALPELRKL